jgi:hypothetical protein
MGHQYRKCHVFEHMAGRSAEKELAPRRPAVCAHDQKIGVRLPGRVQDFGSGLSIARFKPVPKPGCYACSNSQRCRVSDSA